MSSALRASAMLTDPAAEWPRIEQESGDPAFILSHYVAWLALIPALFSFIGTSLIGVNMPGAGTVRTPVLDGLFGAIFCYVMSCATVLVLALLVYLAVPFFGGRRDFDSAFKLTVYSFTPVWLAGIFLMLPGLRFLVLTGFYGAYILWLGLPRLARIERRGQDFTALAVVAALLLVYMTAVAQRLVFGTPGL